MTNRYQLFDQLKIKIPLPEKKWKEYIRCFNRIEVSSKTILLREGTISKKVFLVEQGCIRAWFNNNGKDVTFQFFFENSVVASIESFRKKIPSLVTIETIEPSVLWWIDKKDMDRILSEITKLSALREMLIDALFERTFNYMRHFFSSIKESPQQRYLNLMKEKPQIVQRIPQHYIASYLGITTVHLSRVRRNLAKTKRAG